MNIRGSARSVWLAVAVCAALAAAVSLGLWRYSLLSHHIPLRDLQETPLQARVRLAGVVTYIDVPGKRFWMQDESGAIPVSLDPAGGSLHLGETVAIEAIKTERYDPTEGPASVALAHIRLVSGSARIKLPQALPIPLAQFPAADKNGIQVLISGVVRAVAVDREHRTELNIGTSGPALPLTVPGPPQNYTGLLNAEVRVLGVPEQTTDPRTGNIHRHLWVALRSNVEVVQAAPPSKLYNIRSLYLDAGAEAGHLVRLRGRVAESTPQGVLLQDGWGTIDCAFETPTTFALGTPVAVEGFPTWDGLRIGLVRSRVHPIAASELSSSSPATAGVLPISSVQAIREMSPARAAQALPVRLRGVITYVDPIWRQLYLQDQTAGIYVKYSGHPSVTVGDHVTLTGLSNSGNFAPMVVAPSVQVDGKAPLPVPIPAEISRATAGMLDAQFVSIVGVVHPIRVDENPSHAVLAFDLVSPLGTVRVFTSPSFSSLAEAQRFEDARVEIRGVLGSVFNARRQLIGYQLLVEKPAQIRILDAAVADPYAMAARPIADLLRFSPHAHYGHRVKVEGTVTLAGPNFLYLQDATAGVEIRGKTHDLRAGDSIAAVGYAKLVGQYSPILTDASFRRAGSSAAVVADSSTAESLLDGHDDSRLVALNGRLITVLNGPARSTLVMQAGVRTFTAQLDTADRGENLGLRAGSVLRLTGICIAQVEPDKIYTLLQQNPSGFQILLRSRRDIAVVRPAPFWTQKAILILLGIVSLLLPAILVWVGLLRRRVHQQMAALRKAEETAHAMKDLSDSMQNVAREQCYDKRVSVRGSNDIARLVVGFNHMLAELHERDQQAKAAEAKLQHMAMVDELTGLPNRRMLFERLSQKLAIARREGRMLALLYIDLDGFKLVNDTFGHNIGDLLLAQVAQYLRARARASDIIARIGGDEFILILDKIRSPQDAETVARTLLDSIGAPFTVAGHTLLIGASIGISIYPDHGSEGGQLLQQADCAMYAAKNNGKNQMVQFGDGLGNAARERLMLESHLRRAVADGSIEIHYQPEFDLASHAITRFEALARWTDPILGEIPPLQFIPIAEESGLIFPLGANVLERACRDAVRWNAQAGRDIPVAVNVSSVQFARDSFVEDVERILRHTGLPPHLLQLELTESATLAGIDRSTGILQRLKALGISLAIDDFGTGYSCLSYLPRLPFDALKIDRSFVIELMNSPESKGFVQSILTMAHNLNMRVIVEGIETEDELHAILALGADEAQGYLLGFPVADPLALLFPAPGAREPLRRKHEVPAD